MGQRKNQLKYRDGDSSSGDFLSPSTGTFSAPMRVLAGKESRSSIFNMLPYAIGVFGLAFLGSCITASIATPVQNSDATSSGINADINSVAYYVNISTNNGAGGTITENIQATYGGTLGVIPDVLKVTSNTPAGYQIYVSAASGHDQKLTNSEDSTKFLSPVDTSSYSLPSTPGTLASANTWGVAVDPTYNAAFNDQDYSGTITQAHKFAPLPAYGNEKLLASKTTATTGGTDTITVYYGYHANSALPSGEYANTVMYTAYAESTSGESVATYTGDLDYKNGGEVVFTTSLFTDRDLSTTPATVTVSDGTTTQNCSNVVLGKVQAGTNDSVTITCDAPTWSKPGDYTATVSIPSYGYNASTILAYDTDGITVAGNTIKTMQAMTSSICQAWDGGLSSDANWDSTNNKPKAFTSGSKPNYVFGQTATSADAIANPSTAYTDAGAIASPTNTEYWNRRRTVRISNINADVPETYLKDTRDGNYYRIRKYADGNCWMSENLRTTFLADGSGEFGIVGSDGTTITGSGVTVSADNTNITSGQVSNFINSIAKTEVSGTLGSAHTVWGASSTEKHPTATASVTNNDANSIVSATFSRSYYNATTKSNCANGLNNPGLGTSTSTTDDCFIGDGDEQTIGTYYNFTTATAGTNAASGNSTSNSICPKGWQLPVNDQSNSKSWGNLIVNTYGGGDWNASTNTAGTTKNKDIRSTEAGSYSGGDYHLWAITAMTRMAPLSLPFSGYYHYFSGAVLSVGLEGYWWSSTATSASKANALPEFSGAFYPQGSNYKGYGFSVRCVAQ